LSGVTISLPEQQFERIDSTLVPAVFSDLMKMNLWVCEMIMQLSLRVRRAIVLRSFAGASNGHAGC
jgi:hypothetical protein